MAAGRQAGQRQRAGGIGHTRSGGAVDQIADQLVGVFRPELDNPRKRNRRSRQDPPGTAAARQQRCQRSRVQVPGQRSQGAPHRQAGFRKQVGVAGRIVQPIQGSLGSRQHKQQGCLLIILIQRLPFGFGCAGQPERFYLAGFIGCAVKYPQAAELREIAVT